MCRVVGRDLDPAGTSVADVMTPSPVTAAPDWPILRALEPMAAGGYRHLPVVEGDRLLAIVSIRALYAAVTGRLQDDVMTMSSTVTRRATGSRRSGRAEWREGV